MDFQNVEKISDLFITKFLDLNKDKEFNFVEVFVGFIYSEKKLLRTLDLLGIINKEKMAEINKQLDILVNVAVNENFVNERMEIFKIKGGEK